MKIVFKRIKYFIIIILFFISSCKEKTFEKAKNQKNNVSNITKDSIVEDPKIEGYSLKKYEIDSGVVRW